MTAKTAWLLLGAAAISFSTPAHAQEMSPEDAAKLAAAGEAPAVSNDLKPVEVAAWTSICRVVLNLHETVTRN